MLGVGDGIDDENLRFMSGPVEYQSGVNTIGTADYSIGNFQDLADDLEAFVSELCLTPFHVEKDVYGAVCDGIQQFRFIMHNPGTESAATAIQLFDTFPNGYTNIMYSGPMIKLCIGAECADYNQPQPDNAFIWSKNSLPPGGSDTLILSVQVLPPGPGVSYTNIAWGRASNTFWASDTVTSPNFVDDLPPEITCPSDVTISCSETTLPPDSGMSTAFDPDGSDPEITFEDVIDDGSCPHAFVIQRTWTARDGCNNTDVCVQTIVVHDTSPPDITCPPDITVSCEEETVPDEAGYAFAEDACDPEPAIGHSDITISGSCPQEFSIIRTWTTTDACGNSTACEQTITIDDSTAPDITCPPDVTIACTGSTLPDITGTATATDNCLGAPQLTFSDFVGGESCSQLYTLTRTWIATDPCGNTSTCVQNITLIDDLAPDILCPPDVTISCSSSSLPGNTGMATATDICDPSPDVLYSDVTVASPNCAQEYTITRTWMAEDDCGNTSFCMQTIVVEDVTLPGIVCPPDITIECTASTLPVETGTATATDNCTGSPLISYSDVTTASMTCTQEYTITRTWVAMDDCGNSNMCVQIIVIDDSTAPGLNCPANLTIECTDDISPASTGFATATDNCDEMPVVTYSDLTMASPLCLQEYTIIRTWLATDVCGNTSTCDHTITVDDSVPPEITCPPDVTIECIESTLPEDIGVATATDLCDAEPNITHADVTMSVPGTQGYIIDRTWTAEDACGNPSSCVQVIHVLNLLDPEMIGDALDTICSGESVGFEGVDPGIDPYTMSWSFGSGSDPSSAMGLGPHEVEYAYNGTNGTTGAWVLLTLGAPGCEDVTDTVANIHVNVIPDAGITSTGGNPCVSVAKIFQPVAPEVTGYTYYWDFGAGASIPDAEGYGPHSVKYWTDGMKTVRLIVHSNEEGASCVDSSTVTFMVNPCLGHITGGVFRSNGTGIGAVNVRLYADLDLDGLPDNTTILRSVNTNSGGFYTMPGVLPGHYVIVQVQPTGFFSLYDEDTSEDFDSLANLDPIDDIIPITIEPLEIDADNNFVEVSSPGIISGYVFQDFDGNEIPAPVEGIQGVTVELFTDNDLNGIPDIGGLVLSTTTSGLGYYTFGGMPVGNYVIVQTQPAGYVSVKDFDASNDGDLVPNTDMMDDIIPVTLTNAETDAHNYFIEFAPCSGVVTSTHDNAQGSLRYMIDCSEEGDTITFHPVLANQTITLNTGRLIFNKSLYIHSGLTPRLMIASNVNGAIKIEAGKSVEFKNVNITSGLSGFPGAAFDNYGHLTVWDVIVYRNTLLLPGDYLIFNGIPGMMTVKGGIQIDSD